MTKRPLGDSVGRPDVAVIGASAAGLAAAIAAARAGANVLLLETKKEIGTPAAPAIVGFDHLWPEEIPRPTQTVRRRLEGVHLRASDGRGPWIDAPLTLFERERFDKHLAHEAEKAGAKIETGTARDAASLVGQGKVVIFADGARTQATRWLRPVRDPAAISWGAVLEFEAEGGDETRLGLTLGPHAPGGRSQTNPLGDGRWSHWTFFRGDPAHAEPIARRALEVDARLAGWKSPIAYFRGVAPDPVYTVPSELARGNVMVAGGAAGQGGLEVGLASGWVAGEAAARGEPASYERAWRRRYQKGYERLRRATDALAHLTDAETRALLGAWDGARVPLPPSLSLLATRPRGAAALARAALLGWARG